jgi:hypothetical protein
MKQYGQADPKAATPWLTNGAHKLEKPVAGLDNITAAVVRFGMWEQAGQ